MRHFAGPGEWERLEAHLQSGTMTLRDVLAAQANFVRGTIDEAAEMLARTTVIDSAFTHFVETCESRGVELTIVSSGIAPLIESALHRHGLGRVNVRANAVSTEGAWTLQFRDDSPNGHDKAAAVRAAIAQNETVAYVGDGYSDYDAALAANVRFAKRGRSLERYLRDRGVAFTPFSSFSEVEAALFS